MYFTPRLEAGLDVTADEAGLDVNAQVEGAPNIQSSVSSLDFGSQVAGQLSDPQDFTLTNTGSVDLILGTNKIIGENTTDFIVSSDFCSFQTLSPGESCQFEMDMRPTEIGDRSAQFAMESDDPDEPVLMISLTGIGTGSGGCGLYPFFSGMNQVWGWILILSLGFGGHFLFKQNLVRRK